MGILEILDRIFFFLVVHLGPAGIAVAVALMAAPFVLPIKKMRKYWRVDRQWSKSLDRRLSRLAKDDFGPESAKVYRSMEEVNSVEVER